MEHQKFLNEISEYFFSITNGPNFWTHFFQKGKFWEVFWRFICVIYNIIQNLLQ